MKSNRQKLFDAAWLDYERSGGGDAARNRLVELHLPLVEGIANRLAENMKNAFEADDLFQWGVFGLVAAIKRFDRSRNVRFTTFATPRIRGSMIDGVRMLDISRTRRQMVKRFNSALGRLRSRLGRTPTEEETAAEMGVEPAELAEYARASVEAAAISLDAPHPMSFSGEIPVKWSDMIAAADGDEERSARLTEFMELADEYLTRREQVILRLYYFREWDMNRIAGFLGLCDSRVSQIHDRIIIRLRSRLSALEEDLF